jgi:uncharacterized membrane-anchored protein
MSAVVSSSESRAGAFARVPAITAYFWIIKFLTTAMGEAASDYAVHRSPLEAVALGAAGLAAALAIQFSLRRYLAWSYWLVVAMISVFGTMAADLVHKAGVPHPVSTLVFAILLAATFILWNAVEKSLSVHSIFTLRREMFYWVTVFVSFAFGTAAGDWTAGSLHLGNLLSGVLFAILFVIRLERHLRILVCLCHDAALGRILRRLVWQARKPWWPWLWPRSCLRGPDLFHCDVGGVSVGQQTRCQSPFASTAWPRHRLLTGGLIGN